jgi:hypothetical protein
MQERERAGQAEPLHALEPGEELHERLATDEYVMDVTNRRLLLTRGRHVAMDLPIDDLRRIQFDIERTRPATFVIVPEHPSQGPEVLDVPHAQLTRASRICAFVGERLGQMPE